MENMEILDSQQVISIGWQISHALTPIQTDEQYDEALKLLETVWDEVGDNTQHPLESLLSLTIKRVQEYEDWRWPDTPVVYLKLNAWLLAAVASLPDRD